MDNWNATHAYKLDYWQPQEGDYPKVSPDYKPSMVVTFESNGGSAVAAKRVSENSHLLMPDKPTKEGHIFAGWYEDAGFTKVFDFDSTAITQSMTLYAKWLEPTYDEYDYSIFSNKFATEFHITNKAQLLGFMHAVNGIDGELTPNNFKGKTVYLDCDILLNDTTDWEYWGKYTYAESWTPIGTGSYYIDPIHPFLGTFDGQGHVISGLYMDGNEETIIELEEHGLFGYIGTKGETTVIRNLGLQASVADMRGNRIDSNIGLLAGVLRDGTITQCFTQGKIIVDANSNEDIGGLVGQLGGINYDAGGVVTDCYSQVDIVYNPMDINATNRGVFGSGMVDWNNGSISNSYVAGGSWQEGVAGGTISNVYYNKELSPKARAQTGTALTTNEMHAKSCFAGFDFDSIWGRNDTINGGYPYLRCFYEENIPDSPDPVKVTGIDFTEAGMTFDIIEGEQLQLHAKVLPDSALEQQIIWTKKYLDANGQDKLLSIDSNGLVTTSYDKNSLSINKFVITASTYEGNYQKKCTVNVHKPQVELGYVKQCRRIGTTEWVEPEGNWKVVGWEYQVAFYITPDSLHQPFTIKNSNPDVASVEVLSQDTVIPSFIYGSSTPIRCGLYILSVHKEGDVVLEAFHPKGYTHNYTSKIPIKYYEMTGISIGVDKTTIMIGETLQLMAQTTPIEASVYPDSFAWSSNDESILKVDQNGVVTAVGAGTATITLTSSNPSFTTTKEFTVEHIQPSRIEIISSDEDSEIYEGDTCMLTVHFTPENTTMRDVEWGLRTAGDTTYVKLIPMGDSCKVIGLKEAWRIYIQAKSLGSSGRYGEYGLCINKKVLNTSLSFHNTSVSMVKGETKNIRLNKTISSNESIIFKSSNEDIITIDEESQYISTSYIRFDIKALAAGTATITATAKESGLTATCEVTVTSNDFFTITFVNEDGTVLQSSQVREGEIPVYIGETPTKAATAEHTYTFVGWTPELVPVTTDATYTATYTEKIRTYQIRFLNYDGTELQSSQVEYGALPEYMGETPARPSTEQYNYVFDGWTPEIVNVTEDASYTATYTSILRQYTVTFLDWDGTLLNEQVVDFGSAAIAPAAPVREGYTFIGWDKDFSNVQSDLIVTAQYTRNTVYYTITFVNDDGTVLQTSQVEEGTMPEYTGDTPTKQETDEFRYFFESWTPEIVPAIADATYTATYTAKTRHYYIQFVNYDGTVLQSSLVAYGTMPEYTGETPTKPSDQYDYIFAGWTPEVIAVTGFATYTATYTEQRIMPVLSNDEVYHITQPYRNNTAWAVERGGTQMLSNMQIGAENKSDDPRQQFAFLTFDNGETYYLYHEAEQKYISKEGQLVDVAVDPVYFKRGAYESTFIVYFDADHYVNVNDYGNLVIDYWKTPDGGNSCVITAVPKYVVTYYTVTFLDWDGTELHVEQVEEGHDAVGPATNPTREGYTFIGWSKPITNITSNLIVIAQYEIVSAVSDIEAESKHPKKVIEGNQLIIILPDGSKYSATGQKL